MFLPQSALVQVLARPGSSHPGDIAVVLLVCRGVQQGSHVSTVEIGSDFRVVDAKADGEVGSILAQSIVHQGAIRIWVVEVLKLAGKIYQDLFNALGVGL